MRSSEKNLLLLDCGGVFPFRAGLRKMKADVTMKAMEIMGYNAMNLGGSDFSFGVPYLKKLQETLSFPFISSNTVTLSGESPEWLKNYTIIDSEKKTIGILGVMPESAFDELPEPKKPSDLKIISPEVALRQFLPEVLDQADYIVLLSQLSMENTALLVEEVPGIDLAISHEKRDFRPVVQDGETLVTPCGTKTSNIEIIKLIANTTGQMSISQHEPVVLGDEIPHDAQIDELITNGYVKKQMEIRRQRTEAQRQELHKSLREGLNKSPEEFFKEMKQKQSVDAVSQ